MTENKLLAIFLFVLAAVSALFLGYLFLWPEQAATNLPSDNTSPPLNVAQAEKEFRDAGRQRETLTFEAEQARNKANEAKEAADNFQRIAAKNGVDINDPNSKTAIARGVQKRAEQDAEKAERMAKDADDKYRSAESNLFKARNPSINPGPVVTQPPVGTQSPVGPVTSPTVQTSFLDNIANWLPTVLALLSLALVLALFWWTWKLQKNINVAIGDLANILLNKQSDKFAELTPAVAALKDVQDRLARLQTDLTKAREDIQTERQTRQTEKRLTGDGTRQTTASDMRTAPEPPVTDEVVFPIAAGSFLDRIGGARQIIKPDPLKGILVRDPEDRGQLVLVNDRSVPGGQLCIVPRITRLRAAQDFHNHYEKFYDCGHPGAGDVWIAQPAVVTSVDGGWSLLEKGILEIKN
jgi:hypothetical protein